MQKIGCMRTESLQTRKLTRKWSIKNDVKAFPPPSGHPWIILFREKLATLRATGEAVRKRRREFTERPEAINQFGQCMQLAQKAVDSFKAGDEKFNHLDTAEVEKVQKAIAEKQDWFSRMCADVSKLVTFLKYFHPGMCLYINFFFTT